MAVNRREKDKRKLRYAAAKEIAEKQQKGFEPTSVEIPKGISFFGFKKDGNYRLDVIPFIAKEGNPNADEGLATWERTYRAHDGIGPEGKRYACLSQNFKKRCPICEHAKKLRNEGADQELIDSLEKTKKRQVVRLIDLAEPDKGIQIYEGPYYKGLGELIDNKIDASEEDSPYRDFHHLEGGMRLVVKAKQEHYKGRSYFAPVNVEMEHRKKNLEESLLDEEPHPDDCIKELDYDELKEILLQTAGAEEDTEDDEKPKKKRKAEVDEEVDEEEDDETDEDEEEEHASEGDEGDPRPTKKIGGKGKTAKQLGIKEGKFVMYKKMECEVLNVSPDGTSLTLEDEDGKPIKAVDPSLCKLVATKGDEEDEETEEEEETPKAKKGKGKPPSKSDDDDEDLEEDEEEEETDEEDEDDEEPLEDDEDLDDDEDEEEEKPKRKKK